MASVRSAVGQQSACCGEPPDLRGPGRNSHPRWLTTPKKGCLPQDIVSPRHVLDARPLPPAGRASKFPGRSALRSRPWSRSRRPATLAGLTRGSRINWAAVSRDQRNISNGSPDQRLFRRLWSRRMLGAEEGGRDVYDIWCAIRARAARNSAAAVRRAVPHGCCARCRSGGRACSSGRHWTVESDSDYVVAGAGQLTDRQVLMVEVVEQYGDAWRATDGERVASFMSRGYLRGVPRRRIAIRGSLTVPCRIQVMKKRAVRESLEEFSPMMVFDAAACSPKRVGTKSASSGSRSALHQHRRSEDHQRDALPVAIPASDGAQERSRSTPGRLHPAS